MAEAPRDEGHLVRHQACTQPDCGSSDGAAVYSNGWIHCFVCAANYHDPENPPKGSNGRVQESKTTTKGNHQFVFGSYQALTARGISEEVCKKFRYQIGTVPADYPAKPGTALHGMRGKRVHIENYYDGIELIGQKLRDREKNFAIIGKPGKTFFGRPAAAAGGKLLVITEGAIDAMSYAEVRKNWPVVSIPNGADSAKGTIAANLEYLESFDKVVLCFDNDKAGQEAVESCMGLLSPGKLWVGKLSDQYKDFNEALDDGNVQAILSAVFGAEEVRPDGLVKIEDLIDDAMTATEMGLPWFLPELTHVTYGRRYGEVYGLGAGTGVGKTDFFTEQAAYDVTELGLRVGILFLEQQPKESVLRLAGKIGNRRFHVPNSGWTRSEFEKAVEPLKGKVVLYNSFGETEWQSVKTRIRHMAIAEGIKVFYVDHLTAMADTGDEKGSLEQIMKEMAGLANELRLIIHFISHLATPDGKPHEEGGRVMIRHFKGSRAIGFWSFFMFGMERDQQAEDEDERKQTTFRVLKDRYTGQATGHTILLGYDEKHGRLHPLGQMRMSDDELEKMKEDF